MVKQIEIITKPCSTKDGKKFTAYKAVQKNGKYMDCRFTLAVGNIPLEKEERFFIEVEHTDMNVDRNRKYPILYIKHVNKFIKAEEFAKETEINEEDLAVF